MYSYSQRGAFIRENNQELRDQKNRERANKEENEQDANIAKEEANFIIEEIDINIKKSVVGGNTDEKFLLQKIGINKGTMFKDEDTLKARVEAWENRLKSIKSYVHGSSVSYDLLPTYDGKMQKVKITIKAKEGFNFLAVPSAKYNTNSGLLLGARFRQYNFLGKHERFNVGLNYNYDENQKNAFFATMGGTVPMVTNDQPWKIRFGAYGGYFGETLDKSDPDDMDRNVFTSKLGFDVYFDLPKSKYQIRTAFMQEINVSAYQFYGDDAVKGKKDDYYLRTSAAISFPVPIVSLPYIGLIEYNYSFGANVSYRLDKMVIEDSRGLFWNTGTGFRFSNYKDYPVNFKKGYELGMAVGVGFNPANAKKYGVDGSNRDNVDQWAWRIAPVVNLKMAYPFNKYVQIKSRFHYEYSIFRDDPKNNNLGRWMRGIYDDRVSGDMFWAANFDLTFNMYLGSAAKLGELHLSVFYDIGMAREYSSQDWFDPYQSMGLELIIYPSFSRNLNLRISYGFDLDEAIERGKISGSLNDNPLSTDTATIGEFFFGFQIFYE